MEHSIPKNKSATPDRPDLRVRRSREGLRSALLVLLNGKAFEAITIREIVAAATIGYTTFFRHYPSKEALLDAVVADEIQRLTNHALPVYQSGDPFSACLALCTYVAEHRPLWTTLLTGGAAPIVREEMLRQSRAVASVQDGGALLPLELGNALAVAVILELLSWWLRQADPWTATQVAEVLHSRVIIPSLKRPDPFGDTPNAC